MKSLLGIFWSFVLLWSIRATAAEPLSAESKLVQKAYFAYKATPLLAQAQINFLSAFPKSRGVFLRVFEEEPNFGQLSSVSPKYIMALERLGKLYPKNVIQIEIGLAKQLAWSADAINYLQHATITMAMLQPRLFAAESTKITSAEQQKLCAFLAGGAEGEDLVCTQLVKEFIKVGSTNLAKRLRQAQIYQMNRPE